MEREVKKRLKKKEKKCKSDSHFSSFSFLLHFHFLVASYPLLYLFIFVLYFRFVFLFIFHRSSFKCTSINSFPHNVSLFFSLFIPRKRNYYQLFARIDKITSSIFLQLSRVRKYSFLFPSEERESKNSLEIYITLHCNLYHYYFQESISLLRYALSGNGDRRQREKRDEEREIM